MTKIQIKRMMFTQLTEINTNTTNIAISKWKVARAIYEIKQMVNWRKSPYESFGNFCKTELASQTVANWIYHADSYGKAINLGYTDKNIFDIAEHHSYGRLAKFFKTTKKKIAVSKLKKMTLPTAGVVKRNKKPSNQVCFALSNVHMSKLVALLQPYGLSITNSTKVNISAAMEAYLDTVI